MATMISLDPRVTRLGIDKDPESAPEPKAELDQFHTYEVFHQGKTGAHHMHVGIVHAPNAEMALLLAKEQYGRRGQTVNLWVVNTRDVVTMEAADSDIFTTTPEKTYRDVGAYMVRNKVEAYKKKQQEGNANES
ncbi:MAG: hypothetical protein ACKOE4_09255 [Candidatus Kapaibacterium sp.]